MSQEGKVRCAEPDCKNEFVVPPDAPHKKFCSAKCRNKFHGQELRQLRAEIKRKKAERQATAISKDRKK